MEKKMKQNKQLLIYFIAAFTLSLYLLMPARVEADSFNSGLIELNMKNYDAAIQHFQQALRQDPYHAKAYNNLGMALKKKGDFNNAILAYQQALKIDPHYGTAYYNYGLCLKDAGKPIEGIEALQTFINFNPEVSEAIRSKWIANDMREELENVSDQTRKYYLGSYLISDRNYKDAIPPLETAVQMDPNDQNARYALGLALKRTNDLNGALEQFNEILKLNNQNALAYYELGDTYKKMGNINGASQAWQNYSTLAPKAKSTEKIRKELANLQMQVQSQQQQSFMQNQLVQNAPNNYSGGMQQSPIVPQYNQQSTVPIGQQGQTVVPQIGQSFGTSQPTYGMGYSGPTMGTPAARSGRTRIAVLDFDYSSVRPWWQGEWDIGKGVASLITGDLVRSGVYSVIERTALDQILQEQKLSNTKLFDATTAASIGKLLGVDILVLGNITQFGIENKKSGFGAAIPIVAIVSNIQSKKSIASVSFDMRMVSVDTGEILDVTTITGKSKRRGILIDFARGGNAGGIDFSSSNFQDSVLGEASSAASEKATEIINTKYEKITRATIGSSNQDVGVIAYVGVSGIIINAGSSAGLKIGNKLSIERLRDVVKDPITGRVIKALTTPIGEFEVTEIEPGSATGKMVSGSSPQVGDLARFKPEMNVTIPQTGASTSVTAEIMYKKKK